MAVQEQPRAMSSATLQDGDNPDGQEHLTGRLDTETS